MMEKRVYSISLYTQLEAFWLVWLLMHIMAISGFGWVARSEYKAPCHAGGVPESELHTYLAFISRIYYGTWMSTGSSR